MIEKRKLQCCCKKELTEKEQRNFLPFILPLLAGIRSKSHAVREYIKLISWTGIGADPECRFAGGESQGQTHANIGKLLCSNSQGGVLGTQPDVPEKWVRESSRGKSNSRKKLIR